MARSDDVGTWGNSNVHFFLLHYKFLCANIVIFHLDNRLLSLAFPGLCHTVWQVHNNNTGPLDGNRGTMLFNSVHYCICDVTYVMGDRHGHLARRPCE